MSDDGGKRELVLRPFQVVSRESIVEKCERMSKEDEAVFHAVWMVGCPECGNIGYGTAARSYPEGCLRPDGDVEES